MTPSKQTLRQMARLKAALEATIVAQEKAWANVETLADLTAMADLETATRAEIDQLAREGAR